MFGFEMFLLQCYVRGSCLKRTTGIIHEKQSALGAKKSMRNNLMAGGKITWDNFLLNIFSEGISRILCGRTFFFLMTISNYTKDLLNVPEKSRKKNVDCVL